LVFLIQTYLNIKLVIAVKEWIKQNNKLHTTVIDPMFAKQKKVQKNIKSMIILYTFIMLLMHLPESIISVYLATMFNHKNALFLKNSINYQLFVYSSQFYFDVANLSYFFSFSFSFLFNILFNQVFRNVFMEVFLIKIRLII
jgi:hypothetical protein